MRVLITEKLSEHRYKTPEGYLVCVDAILARTGPQLYKHSQVYDGSTDEITDVEVDRKPEQVFSPQAIASFENKPLTIQHPNEPVTTQNHKELYHGFARDIRRAVKRNGQILTGSKRPTQLQDGDQEVLVGNIIVTTSEAIEAIENGLEFLSCGYDCDITQTDTPEQINIRGNHIALCDNPRAGITMLQDNLSESEYLDKAIKDFNKTYPDYKVTKNKSTFKGHVNLKIEKLNENANFYKTFKSEWGIIKFFWKYGFDLEVNRNTKNRHLNYRVYVGDSPMKHIVKVLTDALDTQVNDAINYVVMCEVLYNGVAVKSRAPWIVFRTENKSKAERFVRENNAKVKSLVGFSQHYYIR